MKENPTEKPDTDERQSIGDSIDFAHGGFAKDFGPFNDHIWLNCAHQGPLPKNAAEEAREAISWKVTPYELTTERFLGVPDRVRKALSRLLGAPKEEIVLSNSASRGLHLLANGIPWRPGDEILLVYGDFPSDILPWLGLVSRGVVVRTIKPAHHLPDPDELEAAITPATRLFCTTWVHSFSGKVADIPSLGHICKEHGVTFVVNGSQAVGARPVFVADLDADALVGVGFKWLCGPYGTGYCWIKQDLLRSLEHNQAYWLSMQTADDLGQSDQEVHLPEGPQTGRRYDIFGTANFFNYKPWAASMEYLLDQGIDRIAKHDQDLVSQLIDNLDNSKYQLISPSRGRDRSTLVYISCRDQSRNQEAFQLLKENKIGLAFRRGLLRFSPHLYNTVEDINLVLDLLHSL